MIATYDLSTCFGIMMDEIPNLTNISRLAMLVVGASNMFIDDVVRNALSLLSEPCNRKEIIDTINNMKENEEIIYKQEAVYLYEQLRNKVTIFKEATYVLPNSEEGLNSSEFNQEIPS
ncbi:unnamed protein product [Adineta steineri]|uniref:Uncharacterized protein n=1 Tax=Adineta steineri TaxID=433720 RepID=A0A815KRI9_9BILA|nr:unnamed protein product [Adineta steineri]